MSIIVECDNCGQRQKYKRGDSGVPYGHEGAIQWMSGSGEMRPYVLVMEYICGDCRTEAERKAEEARAAALMARKREAHPEP